MIVNLSLGSFVILFVMKNELNLSLLLIFLVVLVDWFDGMVVRKL